MQDIADAPDNANPMEKADVAVTQAVAPMRHSWPVKLLGNLSDLSDQPPLIALSAGTMIVGLARRDRALAETGGRMLAAHLLATAIKSAFKARIVRTRPKVLAEGGTYRMHEGEENTHRLNSFPSGHTAGAVAVARAAVRGHPDRRPLAYALSGGAALMQIPRCAHYPSDVGAGIAVGVAAEAMVYGAELALSAMLSKPE